jgi:hypothetical protein
MTNASRVVRSDEPTVSASYAGHAYGDCLDCRLQEARMEAILNMLGWALDGALLGFVAYGGYLVLGAGGFHRDAPEDAALPHLDVSRELDLHLQ